MIKYLELALSQEVYEYLEELDEMNWSARGNVLNQYLRNTSIGTTVSFTQFCVYSGEIHSKFLLTYAIYLIYANLCVFSRCNHFVSYSQNLDKMLTITVKPL